MKGKSPQEEMRPEVLSRSVLAIGAHPDDIEFMMAGTLILLKQAGWHLHYMNIANGSCGTATEEPHKIVAARRQEAIDGCKLIAARYYESITNDLEVYHTTETVARVVSVIRQAQPRILLLLSPTDYMEDHTNACRIGVTAALARGMRNAPCDPPLPPVSVDLTIYHCLPIALRDPLRRIVRPELYVNITSVIKTKRAMLAKHRTQKEWLDVSQGIDAYLESMETLAREIGTMSGTFEYAEGWRRRLHLGFSPTDYDPLSEALADKSVIEPWYEKQC